MAPSGEEWFSITSPHFRVHHTLPLEPYARTVTQTFERALPELEKRMDWKAPAPIDIVVMDPVDSANGLTMNFPNDYIELFASPFGADSVLAYYESWPNEIATHELTHMVANDTTLGFYKTLRSIFGSWVKPNGIQPVWLSEGLAVYQETSLTRGGRGRSPLLDALLREAFRKNKLNADDYTSIDRFNDGVPWWPAGNTQYLLGYTIQALGAHDVPNLPGKISHESGGTIIFAPDRVSRAVQGKEWAEIWAGAGKRLAQRYASSAGEELHCALTNSGRFTGGHAVSPDGWIYFSEEDWDRGTHLARVRGDAPCGKASVERLIRKNYGGPGQVAVSPNGKRVAFAALDPGFETEFSDVYLWSDSHGQERVTDDERTRDPAFLDDDTLLYVKANADTSQSVLKRDLRNGQEATLFTSKPMERVSGLASAHGRILFSLHFDNGHEKIVELKNGAAYPITAQRDAVHEYERNPAIGADGKVYFAAAYGNGPQEIYRLDYNGAHRVLAGASGYLDRPQLLADGKSLVVQNYGLNGLDLFRVPLTDAPTTALPPREDLHAFLTGEASPAAENSTVPLPPSVPYTIAGSGTSLWPHYWFPEVNAGQDGVLVGASTSGNDALNYHRWYAIGQWDSRARFPLYRAYYRNRVSTTNFHFEALQTNNYFLSSKSSNRNSSYSVEAIVPLWDFSLAFGTAYRQKVLFGSQSNNMLVYQNISIDRSGSTPSAIAPNWGASFNNFTAVYPSSMYESTFVDVRPELDLYTRGFHPSHSVSLTAAAGIATNKFLASNYYQGGGASPLSSSPFIVRGYPTDALFGQKIVTANLAYTAPLAHVYHGLGTNPFFLNTLGLRFMGDAGTANYYGIYSGKNFLYYESARLFDRYLYGGGADLLATGSIFYHVPVRVETGAHYGSEKRYGGAWMFYFALGVSLDRGTFRARHDAHLL